MVFSSILFLLYFLPVLLIVYFLAADRYKNFLLLAASVYFYAWGMPRFVLVILGTTLIDFLLVKLMCRQSRKPFRRAVLAVSLSMNLGLLFYFKYFNFFLENISWLTGSELHLAKILLPIGISFYTFESITYMVDVYRGIHKPLHNFWDYQLYIMFFPKLIAGPIVRYHEIADQISGRFRSDTIDTKLYGLYRFIIGLSKKVLIANIVGAEADRIFALDYHTLPTATAWIGVLSYTMQIYFDFSGYSDMAIGLASLFGFTLPENFNMPYTSRSITEFWKRWHITLGSWMRNYLYIPLGGNRVGSAGRLYLNLWIVFLLSGLWHGASWNFIIWGVYHGTFLVLERAFLSKLLRRAGKLLSMLYAFGTVLIGWVFFRIEKLPDAFLYLRSMFGAGGHDAAPLADARYWTVLAIALLLSFFPATRAGSEAVDFLYQKKAWTGRKHALLLTVFLGLYLLSVAYTAGMSFNPFIYFRF